MKANNTLRAITAAIALTAAAPSCTHTQAEEDKMTDVQRACVRACVQRVLKNPAKNILAPDSPEAQTLFATLEARFSRQAPYRPDIVKFADVKRSLEARPDLLWSLNQMEKTGGQPDVIAAEVGTFVFADLSAESPEGRRSLGYDEAKAMCDKMELVMMDEYTYRRIQAKSPMDAQTWSWILTDAKTRVSGYALRGNRDGARVGVNGSWADRCYSSRGFRGLLRVPKS